VRTVVRGKRCRRRLRPLLGCSREGAKGEERQGRVPSGRAELVAAAQARATSEGRRARSRSGRGRDDVEPHPLVVGELDLCPLAREARGLEVLFVGKLAADVMGVKLGRRERLDDVVGPLGELALGKV